MCCTALGGNACVHASNILWNRVCTKMVITKGFMSILSILQYFAVKEKKQTNNKNFSPFLSF